jgi:uncharacterized protein YciW
MSKASEAYARLMTATLTVDPACRDDDRFLLDDQPAHSLAYVCRACPLFDLCAFYAEAERPKGGIWAGKAYRAGGKKVKP